MLRLLLSFDHRLFRLSLDSLRLRLSFDPEDRLFRLSLDSLRLRLCLLSDLEDRLVLPEDLRRLDLADLLGLLLLPDDLFFFFFLFPLPPEEDLLR